MGTGWTPTAVLLIGVAMVLAGMWLLLLPDAFYARYGWLLYSLALLLALLGGCAVVVVACCEMADRGQ